MDSAIVIFNSFFNFFRAVIFEKAEDGCFYLHFFKTGCFCSRFAVKFKGIEQKIDFK